MSKKRTPKERKAINAQMRDYVTKRKKTDPAFKAQLALYQREWRQRKIEADPSYAEERRAAANARYRRMKKDPEFRKKMAERSAAQRAKQMTIDPQGVRQKNKEAHRRRAFKAKLLKAFEAMLGEFMKTHGKAL